MHQIQASIEPHLNSSISVRRRLWGCVALMLLAALVCWGVILSGNLAGRGAADDLHFHWLAIQQFAQQWPRPDLSDYASATTPGYHLILSPLVYFGSMGHQGVQLVASLWTIALFGVLGWVLSARFGLRSIVLALPMLASMYVLFPGIWLLPDNAGWVLVLLVILVSLRPSPGVRDWLICGVLLVLLVWVRQIHIWAAGVVWLSAWLGDRAQTPSGVAGLFARFDQRLGRTMIALALSIPAIGSLVYFMLLWGGLVPPMFQGLHQGPNTATPGFILLQCGVLSIFFAPLLFDQFVELWRYHSRWVLLAVAAGLLLGLAPHSSYSVEGGRYGGWWNLIAKLPSFGDRSPIFVLGSIAGALSLLCWLWLSDLRDRWIWIGALIAFTLAQSANHASWQRYHEPMLLMFMLLTLARSDRLGRKEPTRIMLGSLVLAILLGGITLSTMLQAKPITPVESQSQPDL